MMTVTYILLWVLIGANAIMIIIGHKDNKTMKKIQELADKRQASAEALERSANGLYIEALEVLENKPKIVAYDKILDAAEDRHRLNLTGEVLTSDLNRDFYKEVDRILSETQEELNK